MIRDYSAAAGIPIDRGYEIHSDIVPQEATARSPVAP